MHFKTILGFYVFQVTQGNQVGQQPLTLISPSLVRQAISSSPNTQSVNLQQIQQHIHQQQQQQQQHQIVSTLAAQQPVLVSSNLNYCMIITLNVILILQMLLFDFLYYNFLFNEQEMIRM